MDSITVTGVVAGVTPEALAAAFLDAEQHALMTDAPATAEGRRFTAWGGYISGETLSEGLPIVQRWSTIDFPPGHPPSRVEIHLRAVAGGTEVRFEHSEIPVGQGVRYETGWVEYYLDPIRAWFAENPSG